MEQSIFETSLIYYDKRDELFMIIPNEISQYLKLVPNGSVKFVVNESGQVFLSKGDNGI